MAAVRRQRTSYDNQTYVYGNVVPRPEYQPERKEVPQPKPKPLNQQVRKNRRRALKMGANYTAFLIVASICAVVVCVLYLQMQPSLMQYSAQVGNLRQELNELTEANNVAYSALNDTVNLEEVRIRAIEELGMISIGEGRVIKYQRPAEIHVIQHYQIPVTGVLANTQN